MRAARLLPEPPDGYSVVFRSKSIGFLRRAYFRIMAGYRDGALVLWVADSNDDPVKVIGLAAASHERHEHAVRWMKYFTLRDDERARLEEELGVRLEILDEDVIAWDRGTIRFAVLTRVVHHCVIGATVAYTAQTVPRSILRDVQLAAESRVEPEIVAFSPPVVWRQCVVAALGGLLVFLTGIGLAVLVNGTVGVLVMLGFFILLVYWLSVHPGIRRWELLRKTLQQGDETGEMRRTLAQLGIELPEPSPAP